MTLFSAFNNDKDIYIEIYIYISFEQISPTKEIYSHLQNLSCSLHICKRLLQKGRK